MQGRLKILLEVEKVRDQLYSSSLGSLLALLQSRAERLGLEEMLNQKTNQEQELIHRLAASRENKEKTINGWLREAEDKLSQIRKEIVTSQQQLIVAERKNKLIVLRAPADGVVLTVGQRSIGSVAKEAETLFTLVPRESDIEAEVEIESADIGRLRVGDPVRIKLEALPYQRYGTIDGKVRVISANSFEPDKSEFRSNKGELGPRFFRARIALGAWQLRDLPPDFRLIPGMTGTAEIIVGKRTIISYLLNPIVRTFDEGLREP
jgi:HlyD family secretion protein